MPEKDILETTFQKEKAPETIATLCHLLQGKSLEHAIRSTIRT